MTSFIWNKLKLQYYPTYHEYRASAQRQRFSIPDSIIYYISKHPSTSKFYQKLIQCCKYFFIKNPILVLHCLKYENETQWKTCSNDSYCKSPSKCYKVIELNKISSKLWIVKTLAVSSNDKNDASKLIQKVYKCDAINISFNGQTLSFNEFLFYSKNAMRCSTTNHEILFPDGSEVCCEKIVENLSNLKRFVYLLNEKFAKRESANLKKLYEMPTFKNLEALQLGNLTESFDIDAFVKYMKGNGKTKVWLYFNDSLSNAYKLKLQKVADELLLQRSNYYQFCLYFPGMQSKMINLFVFYVT